jgi:hypothetical protein
MTGHDVPDPDMPNFPWPSRRDASSISDASLAALLAGAKPPADCAPQLRRLADVLAELSGPPARDELDGEAEALAVFGSQFGAPGPARPPRHRRPRWRSRSLPVKAAVAAGAAIICLGGLATAAYAGALPAFAQRFAHEIIAAPPPGGQPASRPSPTVSGLTGRPDEGLCATWTLAKAHGTRAQQAAAFGKLAAAAGGASNAAAYCAAAAHPGTSPSRRPRPAHAAHGSGKPSGRPTPHGSGKPSGRPTPHGSGKPSGRPTPHGSGKPSGRPTPHGSGKPSGRPTPHGSGKRSGLRMLAGTGGPMGHPRVKPGSRDRGASSQAAR